MKLNDQEPNVIESDVHAVPVGRRDRASRWWPATDEQPELSNASSELNPRHCRSPVPLGGGSVCGSDRDRSRGRRQADRRRLREARIRVPGLKLRVLVSPR